MVRLQNQKKVRLKKKKKKPMKKKKKKDPVHDGTHIQQEAQNRASISKISVNCIREIIAPTVEVEGKK
jgi:hypothetical protein